jgi:hypothetical protein
MAVGVIDFLEVVDVKHEQQGRLAGARDRVDFTAQYVPKMTPVGQAGQWIFQ